MSKILDVHAKKAPIEPNSAFVEKSYLTAVNGVPGVGQFRSDITNRKKVIDPTACLSPSFGLERFPFVAAFEIPDEFGPSGERVQGMTGDTSGLVRFVGNWNYDNTAAGPGIGSSVVGSYMEIVFYGTGLNILWRNYGGSSFNTVVSIDGGADSANLSSASYNGVLNSRNYHINAVLPVVSGLTLGLHTAKFKIAGATSFQINGYEVINTNSTSLAVQPGYATLGGDRIALTAQALSTYNSGFESGTLGTRGGRVVAYLKANGTVGKAVTPAGSQLNLTSADHTNEEIVRSYNWREFGAGRADDFSTLAGTVSARAFTLEDGTTTLIASGGVAGEPGSSPNASGAFLDVQTPTTWWTFTFVGTGLDLFGADYATGTLDAHTVLVDGVSVGSFTANGNSNMSLRKVVSGLPYGTHTVKFNRTAQSVNSILVRNFVVYGPKKPAIPAGAIEIADYNVLADYSGSGITGTATTDWVQVPTGTIFKANTKEMSYVGANWAVGAGGTVVNYLPGGFSLTPTTNNSQPAIYSFFGTGFVLNIDASGAGTYDVTVAINGVLNATGVARSNASNLGSGSYRSTSTSSGAPCRIEFTGLTLGQHTVTVQRSAGTGNFTFDGFHIITPIHSHVSNKNPIQNALPIGSCSLMDSREFLDSNYGSEKAWAQAIGVTSNPTNASTSYVPVPEMSLTIETKGNPLEISYMLNSWNSASANANVVQVYVDGVAVSRESAITTSASGYGLVHSDSLIVPVSAGWHKVDLYWNVSAGTATATATRRNIKAREI